MFQSTVVCQTALQGMGDRGRCMECRYDFHVSAPCVLICHGQYGCRGWWLAAVVLDEERRKALNVGCPLASSTFAALMPCSSSSSTLGSTANCMSSLSGNELQKRRRKQQPVQSKTDAETALHSHARRKSTYYNRCSSVFFSSILALAWYFLLYDPDISQESTRRNTSASPFDIVDLPGRGKGAVANRDIDVCSVIFYW